MHEIWKDIPGYEGAYQASTLGKIKSLDRTITQKSRCGRLFNRNIKGRILRPASNKYNPHLYVVLGHGANGSPVHQLVARTFLGPCPDAEEVRHIDGNARNNCIFNLCYGPRTENILDVYRQNKRWRKLSLKEIKEIQKRVLNGEIGTSLAREYNVSTTTVSRIKLGRYKSCTI
jgi:hypothetical protein